MRQLVTLNEPAMLAWAREFMGKTLAEVADGMGVAERRLEAFESGEARMTFGQLKRFMGATGYHNQAALYLPEVPAPQSECCDFRAAIGQSAREGREER